MGTTTLNNEYDHSRRKTPWDHLAHLSASQSFVKDTYLSVYNSRHISLKDSHEEEFLNTLLPCECKLCGSTRFRRYGHTRNGINRYYCNDCKHTFTILTGTIFEDHKISVTEWVEQLLRIIGYESTTMASHNGRNSITTAKYWNAKLFLVLQNYADNIILSGDSVQIDEMYYSQINHKKEIRDDGKEYAGLSRNQFCIGVGTDGEKTLVLYEGHMARPKISDTWNTFGKHIEPGSHLKHDLEKTHSVLVKRLNLTEEKFNSNEIKKLKDIENPLYPVNHTCFLIRSFLDTHSGFDREELQGYLDLCMFILNKPNDILEKVRILLISALYSSKTLRYRDYYSPKPHK